MRLLTSIFTALIVSFVIFFVSNDFGIVWDEPIHFRNGDQYLAWFKRPEWGNKDEFFRVSTDDVHPPFRKLVAAVTHDWLTTNLGFIDNTRGYRLSALLFVFPFIFLFAYVAGPLAAFMFSFMPHVLFLTPLVTMDYAITALWFIAVITAIKGIKSTFWLAVSGVAVGLTMLTKLHGFLLFVPIVVILKRRSVLLAAIAFFVYMAGWPWLWTNPIGHLTEYFAIQTAHGSVPVLLLGKIYEFAPWWYTPLMFLTTTPTLVLLLFFAGMYWTVKHGNFRDRIFLFNALYPIVFFSLPGVYRYDWVRLFLPAFPFIVLVATKAIGKKTLFFILILWSITLYHSVIRIHPWESAYYNEFVGGISGAKRLGFETEFWGNAIFGILPWMNDHKNDLMCVTPTTHPFYYYQAMGYLDGGVGYRTPKESCKYVIVLMRQGLFIRDPFIESVVDSLKPIHTVSVDGVPLVAVYDISGR